MMETVKTTCEKTDGTGQRRVLLVAPLPFYEDRGTPIALLQVIKSYVDHGCEVDVLTHPIGASPKLAHVNYLRLGNPLRFRSIPIGLSGRKVFLDLLLLFKLRRLLKQHRYTFIHAVEESAFLVGWLRFQTNVSMVYDMQSNMAEQLSKHCCLGWRPLRRCWHRCQRWVIRQSSIVACSLGLTDYVRAASPEKPVHEWHYPGQAIHADADATERLREALDLPHERPVVVYTGNFESYQGIDLLLESMPEVIQRAPNAVFVLVGGDTDTIARLDQRLSGRVSPEHYRLLPRVAQNKIPAYLQLADVLVSPRVYGENLPLKVIEYLAVAKPIVATDVKAHRSVLTDQTAVLVEPIPAALAGGLVRLLSDETLRKAYAECGHRYYRERLGWDHFHRSTGQLLAEIDRRVLIHQTTSGEVTSSAASVSIVIPVRNGATSLPALINAIHAQRQTEHELEIIVVDDGSTDDTADVATGCGARVVSVTEPTGNPAHARNIGARQAHGDFLIFLDADCVPHPGWLQIMLSTYARGWRCIGGSLSMPNGLTPMSRLDYYCGWYHAHDRQTAHTVTQHPPCNLGIERSLFLSTSGYTETQPIAYAHEELAWQSELKDRGIPILFQPSAVVGHHNRDRLTNVLRRNYRWAYSSVESKQGTGVTRVSWLYRFPLLAALVAVPLIPVHTIYIMACWARVGAWEPVLMSPLVLLARIAYGCGMFVGTLRWYFSQGSDFERRPLWE